MDTLTETLIKIDSRKKYGLYRVRHNKKPIIIKDLTPQEVNSFIFNTHYVNEFYVLKERVIRAEMNLDDLTKAANQQFAFDEGQKHFADQLKVTKLDLVNANRLCSSYVYSWFNCVELMEVQVKRAYGENSTKWNEWKGLTKQFYDSHFEYRFLYHVRNYQHAENLIAGVYYGINGTEKPIPMFSKAYLLNFDRFKKSEFITHFQKESARIQALPILSASLAPLKEISKKHLELNRDFFLNCANSLFENFGRFSDQVIGIAEKPIKGMVSTQEFQEVQVDMAKHIIDYYSATPPQ